MVLSIASDPRYAASLGHPGTPLNRYSIGRGLGYKERRCSAYHVSAPPRFRPASGRTLDGVPPKAGFDRFGTDPCDGWSHL